MDNRNQACSQPLPLPPAMPPPTCVEELRKEVATLAVHPLHHLGPGVDLVLRSTGEIGVQSALLQVL